MRKRLSQKPRWNASEIRDLETSNVNQPTNQTTKQTNKETNKPTNRQTNKQTNQTTKQQQQQMHFRQLNWLMEVCQRFFVCWLLRSSLKNLPILRYWVSVASSKYCFDLFIRYVLGVSPTHDASKIGIRSFLWGAPYKPVTIPLLVGRGYPQVMFVWIWLFICIFLVQLWGANLDRLASVPKRPIFSCHKSAKTAQSQSGVPIQSFIFHC